MSKVKKEELSPSGKALFFIKVEEITLFFLETLDNSLTICYL